MGAGFGLVSYSNMLGVGRLPITGGLFLDDNSVSLLQSNEKFPVTQDQRSTARARVHYQVVPRLWVAPEQSMAAAYRWRLEASAIWDCCIRNTAKPCWTA